MSPADPSQTRFCPPTVAEVLLDVALSDFLAISHRFTSFKIDLHRNTFTMKAVKISFNGTVISFYLIIVHNKFS
jgi:hypothetical protein